MKVVLDTNVFVSADRHLLDASGFRGVEVIRPRMFVEAFL
jgi:predicted nucleic acid-binding protein